MKSIMTLALLCLLAVSCTKEAPKWAFNGMDGTKDIIYGVGRVELTEDKSIAFNRSDMQARAELARSIRVYIEGLTTDLREEARQLIGGNTSIFTDITRQTVEQSLIGSRIIERYQDDDMMYALGAVKVDDVLGAYRFSAERAMAADAKARERMREALEELDSAIEKRKANDT